MMYITIARGSVTTVQINKVYYFYLSFLEEMDVDFTLTSGDDHFKQPEIVDSESDDEASPDYKQFVRDLDKNGTLESLIKKSKDTSFFEDEINQK